MALGIPWTVICQALMSMGFPREEYLRGLLFPSLGDLPSPGIEHTSPSLQVVSCIAGRFFTAEPPGKPPSTVYPYPNVYISEKPEHYRAI